MKHPCRKCCWRISFICIGYCKGIKCILIYFILHVLVLILYRFVCSWVSDIIVAEPNPVGGVGYMCIHFFCIVYLQPIKLSEMVIILYHVCYIWYSLYQRVPEVYNIDVISKHANGFTRRIFKERRKQSGVWETLKLMSKSLYF